MNGEIHIQDVAISYGERVALAPVNLTIRANAVTAFVGPSGCGKTSLLKSINRLTDLVDGCEVSGQVSVAEFEGVHDEKTDVVNLRRTVGMIFQKPNPFPFSIRRNFELGLFERGIKSKDEVSEKMESALRQVGLWDELKERLDESAEQLSGGQQQRLCIARALVLEPKVLLMDEPCSALDPISTETIESLIDELSVEITVVIVTHNLAQARRVADDVAVFWTTDGVGRLEEFGPAADVFSRPSSDATKRYLSGASG